MLFLALAVGALTWNAYRFGEITGWRNTYSRDDQPGLYRAWLAIRSAAVVAVIVLAAAYAFGVVPISN